jgi:predicted DNA-binding transcriptional regulator YafY
MRADRLVGTLLVLQAKGLVTAAQLAEEFEISVATARRDLEALSAAGIPVYPQRGRGGGWALLGGARTDLSGLSAPEMQALFTLVGPAAALAPEAKAALRKLVRALPETFRARAEAAASAVVTDATRWGSTPRDPAPLLAVVRNAVVERRALSIRYRGVGASGARIVELRTVEPRIVEPWGVVDKDGVAYLIAGTPGGRRTFRIDRMLSAEPTDVAITLPEGFDLASAWSEISAELEQGRSGTAADVTLPTALVRPFRDVLGGRHVEELGTFTGDDGDRARLRVTSNTPGMLARQLAGWAPELEVVGPPVVREALAAIGRELSSRYS